MNRTPTIIVGAGPAGLATAACLRREGAEFQILEAAGEIAPSWRTHYERLHLHTMRDYSQLPHYGYPDDVPTYPSRQQVVDYLTDYATHFDIEPVFGARVKRARRVDDVWRLELQNSELWEADRLVAATGYNGRPYRPDFEGLGEFGGTVLHSKEYFSGRDFAGENVLVVGGGNSGAEIAIDLFECGARPLLCIRGPVHVNARDFMGIPVQVFGMQLSRLPRFIADRAGLAVSKLQYPDLEQLGIRRPKKGPISMLVEDGRIPMVDIGTIDLIRQGAIVVRCGIDRFEPGAVVFEDGQRDEIAAVVLATGYRSSLGDWLDAPYALDERDLPVAFGEEAGPGLYFVGFRNPPAGQLYDISIEAPRVARSIAEARRV